MANPSNGAGFPLTLTYVLPEPVVTGSVSFTEPGGGTSDWLRFTNANGDFSGTTGGTLMIYYSDTDDVPLDLADTGAPGNITMGSFLACGVSPLCPVGETGPEGNNGFDYVPGAAAPAGNEYVGISDVVVPAPLIRHGLLIFLAVGGVLFGGKLLDSLKKDHLPAA
jgi:hypothetical protein